MSILETEIAGLTLSNPIMNASGILDLTSGSLKRLAEAGVGAVVTKSIGKTAREGNFNPTVVELKCGLMNAMGLPNPGVDEAAEEFRKALNELKIPVIASIYGFSPQEFSEVAAKLNRLLFPAFELNVSCPHVEELGAEIGQNPEILSETVKKVKASTDKPVFVKLTPNVSNVAEMARVAVDAGADAITAVNTFRAMAIDVELAKPILHAKFGGLSGPAIKPIAVRCVYEIFNSVDVPIIGCGGITAWEDAAEFLMAGASAVQIGTAVLYKDLRVFNEIIQGLNQYLKRKSLSNVREIVGVAHRS